MRGSGNSNWKAGLPAPISTVRLEDWVNNFDATLAHVDPPPDPNCARFHEADSRVRSVSRSQVKQPVNARGLGRGRAHAEGLAPLIDELDRAGALEGSRSPSIDISCLATPSPIAAAERTPR